MGDTIDNIKGVPGIGEKGARELISEYGSLENLIAHAAEIPQKRYREPLLANIDSARQSRELARIRTDVPVEFDPDALRYRGASRERCFEIFNELGVPHAGRRIRAHREHDLEDLPHRQHARGGRARSPRGSRRAGRFALRVLPDRPSAMTASIVGLAFSTAPREADYVPIGHRALGNVSSLPLRDGAGGAASRCSKTTRREGRPRPEVRRHRAGAARRHAARASTPTR